MHNRELPGLDELLADGELLTVAKVAEYLAAHRMATANWFGPTGRSQNSTWIDRDGTGWRVWDTDERAGIMDFTILRTQSETEALRSFLRRARHHRDLDSTAVRRNY
ncbi:hypothetical protein HAV21_06515 [Paenarthrobacter sp. MSM-2-10-13]|uniref:hypothetical protein n=1 Tax=Micrococcaceae TaxID=1268 RepID=UPI00115C8C18|nr:MULTISPECIES: hypothetical protein [Micrococcaceae]MCM0616609.1 hypothetical protein [Paenarthrobacter sp. TYUT067]NHW46545.1 hypothetical protein [Paenarthrobacter sp. MSM-2-10-13]TQS94160.1 hypothetical protein EU811_02965 [Arthrobacter sp. TS-15]BCW61343.1 hypothetical protein StoSoilB22_03160 [Arthrobacter sp. StoSoilB22]